MSCTTNRSPIEKEKPKGAAQADQQTSNPNGAGRNVVVQGSTDDRGKSPRQTPTQPVNRHVSSAQVGRRHVSDVFGGRGNQGQLSEGQDDHAEPKPPET